MNLTLPLTPEEEAKLVARARAEGTTPEGLVRKAIDPILAAVPNEQLPVKKPQKRPERRLDLPLMKGTVIGSLSRRDIYDDRG